VKLAEALVDKGALNMQKLRERNTYTPTVILHDRNNRGLSLNSPMGRDSVAGLKTSLNNPDAALTLKGGTLHVR